jgi:hypothetical protein
VNEWWLKKNYSFKAAVHLLKALLSSTEGSGIAFGATARKKSKIKVYKWRVLMNECVWGEVCWLSMQLFNNLINITITILLNILEMADSDIKGNCFINWWWSMSLIPFSPTLPHQTLIKIWFLIINPFFLNIWSGSFSSLKEKCEVVKHFVLGKVILLKLIWVFQIFLSFKYTDRINLGIRVGNV